MKELGYLSAKEIQLKSMSRIIGGQDIIAIAPDGSGKTTTYILGILNDLKYAPAEAPKVLILAADQERIEAIVAQFYLLSNNKNLSIMGLRTSGSMEEEIEDLVAGVDIVVATPNRARAVYLKLGLNLNKLKTFIVDDAEEIIKQGMMNPVRELARSSQKCQHLVFSTVEHEKLHQMIDEFMNFPALIEVEELSEQKLQVYDQILYQVPNFTTKINLLNYLLRDEDIFDKVVVFTNSRMTASKLNNSLYKKHPNEVAALNPLFAEDHSLSDIVEFKKRPDCRVLIVANEDSEQIDLTDIPFIFHFDLPENKDLFIQRVVKTTEDDVLSFTFATDLELPDVKRIEQQIGEKMQIMDLPDSLVIYDPKKAGKNSDQKEAYDETRGGAFHPKKASNAKTYNIGAGKKAKLTMKNKKG